MMKKFFSLLLFLCMTGSLFCFIGCNGAESDADEELIDLYGMEYKIMQIAAMTTGKNDPMFYLEGTKAADLALSRLEDIGSKYNCSIVIEYPATDDKAISTLISDLAIGSSEYSLVSSGKSNKIFELAESECLYPLLDVNDVLEYGEDTFDIYGPPNLLEPAMYKGQLYMITPYAHPGKQLRSGGFIVFRDDIVTDATGLDLREYSEQGYWTWKTFEDVVKKCAVIENGVPLTTGLSANLGDFIEEVIMSNGTSFVENTSEGYRANVRSANLLEALEWVKMLNDEMSGYVVFEPQSNAIEKLSQGTGAMLYARAQAVKNNVAFAISNFGVIPFPCGPKGDPDTNDTPVFIEGLGIFATAEDPSACALIIKDYCRPFPEYPDAESLYQENMAMFWDERDLNVMLKAAKRGSFDYYPCDGTVISLKAEEQIGYLSPTKLIDSYAEIVESVVNEYMIPNKELIGSLLSE